MATQKKNEGQAKKQDTGVKAKRTRQDESAARHQTQEKPAPDATARKKPDPSSLIHQILPYVFGIFAVIFVVFLSVGSNEDAGKVGGFLRMLSYGLFGYGAWLIPVLLIFRAFTWKKQVQDGIAGEVTGLSAGLMVSVAALLHTIFSKTEPSFGLKLLFGADGTVSPGGVLGGFLSNLLVISIQKIATYILLIFGTVILLIFTLGLTPRTIVLYLRYRHAIAAEKAAERAKERSRAAAEREARYTGTTHEHEHPDTARNAANVSDRDGQNGGRNENAAGTFGRKPLIGKKRRRMTLPDELMADDAEVNSPENEEGTENAGSGSRTEQTYVDPDSIHLFDHSESSDGSGGSDPSDTDGNGAEDSGDTLDPIIPDKVEDLVMDDSELRHILIPPESADALPELTVEDDNIGGTVRPAIPVVDDDSAPWEDPIPGTAEELLDVETSSVEGETIPPEPKPKPVVRKAVYRFPPLNLLSRAEPIDRAGREEELQQNGRKLVETLASFRVRTRILSVSQGPTITRYELVPEAGTKVRSIANLVDDISLNLAASGVRIEAPIPGKPAVGIEVPNKTVATVHLRELLDTPAFRNAESRVNVALGMDVAGTPVYCNLAKMPHLLIAGATGMGKSVCINSIISSILYKATPDEVKLILIDPKKVELNKYNGLPQLLIPVVSDPQKAAGALNWAVGEMERRFDLIDEVGTRDIGGYNKIAADDPDRDPMPYVVIIIDELADLMMTAPDAVETSICRLAQKARAAGMHLVIGTQRPSVDVITGLIKANIPSRIAFTVASQVDSKTIIDIGGAEKLIGRGDMLYAPVGLMKPLRVQGAFVSDEEVESICDFIRANIGLIEYDTEIIECIEKEAVKCAQQHGKGGDFGGDDDGEPQENVDPKFREALELAVNAGKISTSLLQRHLSLGYGRAAKIIDRMQALGYVSPPDGTKPRDVLLTKQRYMEMIVNKETI